MNRIVLKEEAGYHLDFDKEIKKEKPSFMRQRFLLRMIETLHDLRKVHVDEHRFMHDVFYYIIEGGTAYYDFLPSIYGPVSFQLCEDLEILERDGFLVFENHVWHQDRTFEGEPYLNVTSKQIDKYSLTDQEMTKFLLLSYPYYFMDRNVHSKGYGALLNTKQFDRVLEIEALCTGEEKILLSIGYEKRTVEALFNYLIHLDIRLLIDTRTYPFSRKFGFSKSRLEEIAAFSGVSYKHMGELGISKVEQIKHSSTEDALYLYSKHVERIAVDEALQEDMEEAQSKYKRVAILSYEANPEDGYRDALHQYLLRELAVPGVVV